MTRHKLYSHPEERARLALIHLFGLVFPEYSLVETTKLPCLKGQNKGLRKEKLLTILFS